jgi:hypothetical protein
MRLLRLSRLRQLKAKTGNIYAAVALPVAKVPGSLTARSHFCFLFTFPWELGHVGYGAGLSLSIFLAEFGPIVRAVVALQYALRPRDPNLMYVAQRFTLLVIHQRRYLKVDPSA